MTTTTNSLLFGILTFLLVAALSGCVTPDTAAELSQDDLSVTEHIVATPDSLSWQDGPASLPPGAKFAPLQGDLAEQNFITLRLEFPPDYEIPPHMHDAVEHVTVLSGTFYIGMGTQFDRSRATEMPAGTFAVMPNTEPHFAYTGDEPVVFQLHSIGPWGITYLDPADDPRA